MKLKGIFKTRKFRYGINATFLTALFIVVIIVLNMLTGLIVEKFPSINIDLSENKQFEISNVTKNALSGIDKDVKITVVLYNRPSDIFYDEILSRYRQISNRISYSYVDPAKDPSAIQKYGSNINPYGTFIIESNDRYEIIDYSSLEGKSGRMEEAESLITNAILTVISDEEHNILFTKGHGEADLKTLKKTMENKYFNVSDIDLMNSSIENCDMIVIACPKSDFNQQELSAIDNFAMSGGMVQIYLDPSVSYLYNLYDYIKEWGVEVKNETVKENNNNNIASQYNGYIPLVVNNEYTRNITESILYPPSLRLDILYSDIKGTVVTPVLTTTEQAATTVDSVTGKYNVALVSTRVLDDNSEIKMFISGSSLRFNEDYSNQFIGNTQLASSVLSGMLKVSDYVEIPKKETSLKALRMTNTQVVFTLILLVAASLGILIYGIVVWSRRRFL